ncbi:MAG: M3 family oligoendopeptidase [Candidatus Riflebacteria bacterium]|nr:M3 family oligoendopeptidase [Candidatus Riflebacteria bacterium]
MTKSRKTAPPARINDKSGGVVWDLTTYFPSFNGPEMKIFQKDLRADLVQLLEKARNLPDLTASDQAAWESVFLEVENLMVRMTHISSYIGCLSAADASNEDVAREEGALSLLEAEFAKLDVELKRSLKSASDDVFKKFTSRRKLIGAEEALRRTRFEAQRTMSTPEETLSADLGVDGIMGWGRLYEKLSGKLEFEFEKADGTKEWKPMAQRHSLMEDADPFVRRSAFTGGNAAWEKVADIAAAALNHISGTRLVLNGHRRIDHFLDVALFQASISRETLDAMMAAVRKNIELPRRMVRLKARSLGLPNLGWQDMDAALPFESGKSFTWQEGRDLVETAFRKVFPELADFLKMALERGWVESEKRAGKRPGAFCTGSPLIKEGRVFMTFTGSLGDASTLAHEIGHAYHSDVMKDMRPYAQGYPMTLAETASTFAEMILNDGMLADPKVDDVQKASVLNMDIGNGIAFLLNIPVRFEFEKSFHEERQRGEVSVGRLKELMVEKQREIYGDTLAMDWEDPYFWASKLHFYITGVTFYNFPYTFGFLLSRGLFARFKAEGAAFLPKYREFLRLSGSCQAEEVAKRSLGVDLTQMAFWNEAISSLEESVNQFESILPRVGLVK